MYEDMDRLYDNKSRIGHSESVRHGFSPDIHRAQAMEAWVSATRPEASRRRHIKMAKGMDFFTAKSMEKM